MSIKTIEYKVTVGGITPATEQFAGTQGDHRVTQLNYELNSELFDAILAAAEIGKVMYRFDVYDGEGGVWSGVSKELVENTVSIELEERHTRHGGKITVYLVLTVLSQDNKTEIELYSFPSVLRLKNRPEGELQDGKNYESISGLAEVAKQKSAEAKASAIAAENSKRELQEIAAAVEEKLKNGEFDGVGVQGVEIINDELIITYTDGVFQNLGNVKGKKGEQGIQGEKGEKGDAGKDAVIDQTYSATSENAQSGVAVAEAVSNCVQRGKGVWQCQQLYGIDAVDNEYKDTILTVEEHTLFKYVGDYGAIPRRQNNGNLYTNTPVDDLDCTNKAYVDGLVGDIESLLGGI